MPNSLSNKHPLFSLHFLDWTLMRDCYRGERQVKMKGPVYLPPTTAHILDGQGKGVDTVGQKAYDAYKLRARFPNFVREAVAAAVGMMHSQPAEIKLPKAMENVRSSRGEPLLQFLRRINTEQLITGRVGLLVDIPVTGKDDTPYVSLYNGERIINWDDGTIEELSPQFLNLVVLDESEWVRQQDFTWESKEKYRVLSLGTLENNEAAGEYSQGVFEEKDFIQSEMKVISWRGKTFEQIPFTFINTCDLMSEPDDPALLDLANLCMTIYRGDADYRHNLFMQGQDTFVTIGGNFEEGDAIRIGAGARLDLPMGADAKYVGVQSSGLLEQRESLARLESRAGTMGAQTLDSTSRERESGASMHIRVAARTADLNQIADAGALGLENALRQIAIVMQEDPNEVKVTPNKEFGDQPLTGQMMVEMTTARNGGFPLSARSMHDIARRRKMTSMTYEEELEQAKKEEGTEFGKPAIPEPAGNGPDGKPTDGGQKVKKPDA